MKNSILIRSVDLERLGVFERALHGPMELSYTQKSTIAEIMREVTKPFRIFKEHKTAGTKDDIAITALYYAVFESDLDAFESSFKIKLS